MWFVSINSSLIKNDLRPFNELMGLLPIQHTFKHDLLSLIWDILL